MDGLQRLVPKPKGVRKMRLYLFELEKIMKKPLHFAAVSGCAVFTFVLWWMYADQADYSMGEGAAAALLLLGVHGLFAALLAMLFTSPVFAEEYSCNMEGLLWTSVKGRKETAWCKAAAALTIALAVYISFLAADLIFVCCVWGGGNWYAGLGQPAAVWLDTTLTVTLGTATAAAVLTGSCSLLLIAGGAYCISAFSDTPFKAVSILGISYFAGGILFDWGDRAGIPLAARIFSFSPAVLSGFQMYKKPWEEQWFAGGYIPLVPVVTAAACIILLTLGLRRFGRGLV